MSLTRRENAWTLCLAFASMLSVPGMLDAQGSGYEPPCPGMILVDDMWLPDSVFRGDSYFQGVPWPGGNVPYAFDANVPQAQRNVFLRGVEDLEAMAGVDFYPWGGQASDYVMLRQYANLGGSGNSPVGMQGGEQELRVGPSFMNKHAMIHEMLHALGWLHEHSRADRDSYVQILTANISQTACPPTPECDHNFEIIYGGNYHGSAYDFASVMHYGPLAFSANGQPTIQVQPWYAAQFATVIGQQSNVSSGDAGALVDVYGPTVVHPIINGLSPGAVVQGAGNTTISIFGSGYYQGSSDGNGILGTQVKVNGILLPFGSVTFVSTTQIDVLIPSASFASPGCLEIRTRNQMDGDSGPWFLGVTPAVPTAGFWAGGVLSAHMGGAVTGIGDVDGDGFDDVAVGSYAESSNGTQFAGRVDCFSGRNGSTIWTVLGVPPRGHGSALANAGDIDGDGINDVIDGAPAHYGANPGAGLVTLRRGSNGNVIRTFSTGVVNDEFGRAVASAGDITQDGIPDVIIGAPGTNRVYVYSGSGVPSTPIRTFLGPSASEFGRSVAGGLDINFDGVPDVVVGAPYYASTDVGRFYIYSGANGAYLHHVTGAAAGDLMGRSVAVIPSPDGRAGGAVLVGVPGANSSRGEVRIYGPYISSANLYPLIGLRTGSAAGDLFGFSVSGAGDVNQDGYVDFAVGAPQGSSVPGYVRVFHGTTYEVFAEHRGIDDNERFGLSVAFAGDTDLDGVPDVIAGAPDASLGCTHSGYAQVLREVRPPLRKKVMITEVNFGEPQGIEVTNFSDGPVSLGGWRVIWNDGTRYVSNAFPAVFSILAGESILVIEGITCSLPGLCPANVIYAEANANTRWLSLFTSLPASSEPLGVGLMTAQGVVIDEVRIAREGMTLPIATSTAGGNFRGAAFRLSGSVCVERIWGLDSNGGGDWSCENVRSFGLENRSSGLRGHDPVAVPSVVINEMIDHEQNYNENYVELRNLDGGLVNLRNWFLLWSPGQNLEHVEILSWPATDLSIPDGSFAVIGDIPNPPAELPIAIAYTHVTMDTPTQRFPGSTEEFEVALYDSHGRVADLIRGTGHDDLRVHNHPRAPSWWRDFNGAAARSYDSGSGATGRDESSTDTNTGEDWRPLFLRSMGFANASGSYGGFTGLGDRLGVRLNETPRGDGLTCIVNTAPIYAGYRWSFFVNPGHHDGQGPFFGLGAEAISLWMSLSNLPPWFGFLDTNGSARIDVPFGTLPPGIQTDDIFIIQDPLGGVVLRTPVIEWDT